MHMDQTICATAPNPCAAPPISSGDAQLIPGNFHFTYRVFATRRPLVRDDAFRRSSTHLPGRQVLLRQSAFDAGLAQATTRTTEWTQADAIEAMRRVFALDADKKSGVWPVYFIATASVVVGRPTFLQNALSRGSSR